MTRSLLLLLLAAPLFAADPAIRFPDPPAPAPSPMPAPGSPTKLPGDVWYVVESDTPLLVFDVPTGVVKVTREDGPLKVKGKFVDGAGVQTKTFRGPHVYTIEAAHTGKVEVLFLPVGAKDAGEAVRKTLEVTEPEDCEKRPKPDPKPDPTPEPDNSPAKLFVVVIEETGEAVAGRGAFFTDATLAARFKDKGHRFRVVDKDVIGADGKPPADVKRFLDAAKSKPYPSVFLVDEKGKTRVQTKVPETPADMIELLKKYGG